MWRARNTADSIGAGCGLNKERAQQARKRKSWRCTRLYPADYRTESAALACSCWLITRCRTESVKQRGEARRCLSGRGRAKPGGIVGPSAECSPARVQQSSARRGQGLVGRQAPAATDADGKEASAAQTDCGAVLLASQRIEYRKRACRRCCAAVEQRTPARETADGATPAGTHAAGACGGAVAGARVAGRRRSPL